MPVLAASSHSPVSVVNSSSLPLAAATAAPARTNLLDLTPAAAREALEAFMAEAGAPRYRAGQVLRRLWQAPVGSFAEMTELPAELRERLGQSFEIPRLRLVTEQRAPHTAHQAEAVAADAFQRGLMPVWRADPRSRLGHHGGTSEEHICASAN